MSSGIISHKGIVSNICNNQLEVTIISESACASCKSKKLCSISEIKEKVIYIESFDNSFKIGESVNVYLQQSLGAYAVFFAYGLPFILMVLTLSIGYYHNLSEPLMGLSVLVLLTVYYSSLYIFRKQIGEKVTFKIEKLDNTII